MAKFANRKNSSLAEEVEALFQSKSVAEIREVRIAVLYSLISDPSSLWLGRSKPRPDTKLKARSSSCVKLLGIPTEISLPVLILS